LIDDLTSEIGSAMNELATAKEKIGQFSQAFEANSMQIERLHTELCTANETNAVLTEEKDRVQQERWLRK
jgi:hypothetical protein